MAVEFFADHCRVTLGKKICLVPLQNDSDGEDGPVTLVMLDELTQWHEPQGAEIELTELAKIAELIERAASRQGLELEFA